MAVRGKATYQKRQKEMARKDKQLRKAAIRAQRKLDGPGSATGISDDIGTILGDDVDGEPDVDGSDGHPQEN